MAKDAMDPGGYAPRPVGDRTNGSPYDRGTCGAYYGDYDPHFYLGKTCFSPRVSEEDMTPQQLQEYDQGYNEEIGHKQWRV